MHRARCVRALTKALRQIEGFSARAGEIGSAEVIR